MHLTTRRSTRIPSNRLFTLGTLVLTLAVASLACGPSEEELARRMASVRAELAVTLDGEGLPEGSEVITRSRSWKALQELYGGEAPETVWVDGEGPRENVDDLIAVLGGAGGDGPSGDDEDRETAVEIPDAYGVARLAELRDRAVEAVEEERPDMGRRMADVELAASYAFLTRAFHAVEGRVDPRNLGVEWYMEGRTAKPLELLAQVRDGSAPAEVLAGLEPHQEAYRRLLEARDRYRTIVAAGGWPAVPAEGDALEEGARGARVALLRERLAAEGDLPDPDKATGEGAVFGPELAEAVRRFQERHGLEPDGVVGDGTLEALNVPAEERLRTIELNLERWRWMPADLGDRYLEVNIPEYRLRAIRGGETELAMNVIVGKRLNQTPVFSDTMTFLVLNPAWNIPESIADAEVVPKLLSDPAYAEEEGIEVVGPDGERMPPDAVLGVQARSPRDDAETADDSDAYAGDRGEDSGAGGFLSRLLGLDDRRGDEGTDEDPPEETVRVTSLPAGYRLRQAPGPQNPLGDVKFMFPNEHNIYLHDTPAGNLFQRSDRGFSHGCVRLEEPLALAGYVLRGDPDWPPERIRQAMASEERIEVSLPEEIPVHLTYFTAWVGDDGRVQFRDDLYGHDQALAKALATEEPLTLDPPRLRGEDQAAGQS